MTPTPAFQFYWSEFIHGTAAMTPEEVGGYIRLLCHQWDSGSVPNDDKAIGAITRWTLDAIASIRHKFGISEDGTLKNARLERVRADQVEYRLKQSENAKKGWNGSGRTARRMRRHSDGIASASSNPLPDECSLTSSSPKGEEVSIGKNKAKARTAEEVEKYAISIGCSPGQGDAFFWKMEGCGWINGGKPVKNWQATITAWHKQGYMPVVVNSPKNREELGQSEFTYVAPPVPNRDHYMRILRGEPDPQSGEIQYLDQNHCD